MTFTNILCKGETLTVSFYCYIYAREFLFYFCNTKPDAGCLVQPKHVAFWITIIKNRVWTVLLLHIRWKVCATKGCFPMVQ